MSDDNNNNNAQQALQDALTRLAQSFQANEMTTPVEQIAECFDHLHDTDRTALQRLFLLLYQKNHNRIPTRKRNPGISANASPSPPLSPSLSSSSSSSSSTAASSTHDPAVQCPVRGAAAARSQASASQQSSPTKARRKRIANANANVRANATGACGPALTGAPNGLVQNEQPIIAVPPGHGAASATSCLGLASRIDGCGSPRPIAAVVPAAPTAGEHEYGPLQFSPTIKALLQTCMTDCSAFLRAVADGKVTLPNGQGWEAAIATKKDNTDLRDLTRIFHRFECYNIYQYVVDAGYHTGAHWIRDMRPVLASKLCTDFPSCFVDQEAANRCLNWVDQGCRYREWAERLSDSGTDLGYLLALPCHVPHSTYTSRCTKDQMMATVVELKCLGIHKVVDQMKLSLLANHIVASLHDMTTRKRKVGSEQQGPLQVACIPAQTVRMEPHLTLPEVTMCDARQYTFDAFEDSWLEDWATEDTGVLHASGLVDAAAAFALSTFPRADLHSPTPSNRTTASSSTPTDPFNEWYQQ